VAELAVPIKQVRNDQRLSWLRPAVTAGLLVPLLVLFFRWRMGLLDADPIAEALNQFGLLALVCLIASLACTPLKLLFGWTWPLRVRKELGLFAFYYALAHFTVYLVFDKNLALGAALDDVIKRKFILVGFLAFLVLIPLALTSTAAAIRRMGVQKWQRLHRLSYAAGILGALHFYWRVKSDVSEPLVYAGVLALLMAVRLVYRKQSKG